MSSIVPPPPHANSFVTGTAEINTQRNQGPGKTGRREMERERERKIEYRGLVLVISKPTPLLLHGKTAVGWYAPEAPGHLIAVLHARKRSIQDPDALVLRAGATYV